MMKLQPFFTYYGGKYRLAPKYPPPYFDRIIEPFAGSAGYSVRYFEKEVILIDLDDTIASTWDYLINVSQKEILCLPLIFDHIDDLDICLEAKYLIGWWLRKGSWYPEKKPSKWVLDPQSTTSKWGEKIRLRIATQVPLIRHWKVIHGEYWDAPIDQSATWFIDPPYIGKSGKKYIKSSKQLDFKALELYCKKVKGQVIVCENLGATWLPFKKFDETLGACSNGIVKRNKEVIWTND